MGALGGVRPPTIVEVENTQRMPGRLQIRSHLHGFLELALRLFRSAAVAKKTAVVQKQIGPFGRNFQGVLEGPVRSFTFTSAHQRQSQQHLQIGLAWRGFQKPPAQGGRIGGTALLEQTLGLRELLLQ